MIALSLYLIGTITLHIASQPHDADAKTIADLIALNNDVIGYAVENRKLPATLNQLDVRGEGDLSKRLKNYEYVINSGASSPVTAPAGQQSFSLCATFHTSAFSDQKTQPDLFEPRIHSKGHQCFSDSMIVN